MGFLQNGGWLMDFNLMDDVHTADFIWDSPIVNDLNFGSDDRLDELLEDNKCMENSRKKARVESSTSGPRIKASREKMRRDKLNDRFLELSSFVDPGKASRSDKLVILTEATRILNQLRLETENLRKANGALQDKIKNLKIEKSELRDEKIRLKAEKERMEHLVKGTNISSPFVPPHSSSSFVPSQKNIKYPNCPPFTMWQWMPLTSIDTSQDHVFRSPVA